MVRMKSICTKHLWTVFRVKEKQNTPLTRKAIHQYKDQHNSQWQWYYCWYMAGHNVCDSDSDIIRCTLVALMFKYNRQTDVYICLCGHVMHIFRLLSRYFFSYFFLFVLEKQPEKKLDSVSTFLLFSWQQSDLSDILAGRTDWTLDMLQRFIQLRLASSIRCPACNTAMSVCCRNKRRPGSFAWILCRSKSVAKESRR